MQARRAEAGNELQVFRSREGELVAELNELRVKVATERQRHTSLHHQRAPMEARLAELIELIAQRQQDIVGYQQRADATVAENAEIAVEPRTAARADWGRGGGGGGVARRAQRLGRGDRGAFQRACESCAIN